jgi:hypothetical protein
VANAVAHLSLALPVSILATPLIVLFLLRIAASVADARIARRSKRVVDAISRDPRIPREPAVTSVSVLTEEPPRDQG